MRAGCQGRPGLGAGRLGLGTAVRCLWQEPAARRVSLRAVRLLTAVEGLRAGMGLRSPSQAAPDLTSLVVSVNKVTFWSLAILGLRVQALSH